MTAGLTASASVIALQLSLAQGSERGADSAAQDSSLVTGQGPAVDDSDGNADAVVRTETPDR